jgi:hypothetical protein
VFCCACGAPTGDALFCPVCGRPIPPELPAEERRLKQGELQEMLSKDNRLRQCHSCGRKDNLHGWDFWLAKRIVTGRDSTGTIASVALSAVTLPYGLGVFQFPGRKTTLSFVRLRLLLCDPCSFWGRLYSEVAIWDHYCPEKNSPPRPKLLIRKMLAGIRAGNDLI